MNVDKNLCRLDGNQTFVELCRLYQLMALVASDLSEHFQVCTVPFSKSLRLKLHRSRSNRHFFFSAIVFQPSKSAEQRA